MKDLAVPANKLDFQDFNLNDSEHSDEACQKLVDLDHSIETPIGRTYGLATKKYSVVRDSEGKVICPDKL